ncbi:MAG TPA: HAD hydrolase-like protein [Haliangiales bacterium]|nr:HAD hydrolase-like protein [Haliangiales bacterium]
MKLRQAYDIPPVESVELSPAPAVILFDLDGTLVDTMEAFADIAAEVMAARFGLSRRNARRLYLQTSGIPFRRQLDVIFGDHADNDAAAMEFETRKHDVAAAARMEPATEAALRELRDKGIKLVVSSNGMQEHVDAFAERTGLFDLALGFDGSEGKGEPHVRVVEEKLGVARDALLFVGDSLRDGEIAAAAGVRFCARAGTFAREEFAARFPDAPVVASVADLASLV